MGINTRKFTDCLDPGFGYENKDGYVRIWDKPKPDGGKLVMRHRWFWQVQVGEIPDGYEINHLCKNRRCCNVSHLECLEGSEHAIRGNKERYEQEYQEFKKIFHSSFGEAVFTQEEWGKMFNRSQACISKWIKRFNKEVNNGA